MPYGPNLTWTANVASGASSSSILDVGKSFNRMSVMYTTMSTGTVVNVFGAVSSGATFFPVTRLVPSTATVVYQPLQIPTAVSGGNWATFEAPPFRYLQLVATAVVSGGISFTITGND